MKRKEEGEGGWGEESTREETGGSRAEASRKWSQDHSFIRNREQREQSSPPRTSTTPHHHRSSLSSCSRNIPYPDSTDFACFPPSFEIKNSLSVWLQALGCSVFQPDIDLSKLTDPFRNGLLVCEVVEILEKRRILDIETRPRDRKDVLQNFEAALETIRKGNPPGFNRKYYAQGKKLAEGSEDEVWTLLWCLCSVYGRVFPAHLQSIPEELPYDLLGVSRLEVALLSWLQSISVLPVLSDSFLSLLPTLSNGVLLCKIVSAVFHTAIPDFFPQPKTDGGVLSNLRKVLDVLKQAKDMSQKFVWGREKDIMKGNLGVILGLLEDLYRCYDGLPIRKPGTEYHYDGPYLGLEIPKGIRSDEFSKEKLQEIGKIMKKTEGSRSRSSFSLRKSNKLNRVDLATRTTDVVPNRRISFATTQMSVGSLSKEMKLWLLALKLPSKTVIQLTKGKAQGLQDGVILCTLLQSLERVTFLGIEHYPKTAAACRQNLRKALEFLVKKPAFPPELHYIEDQLLEGKFTVWLKLLSALQKLYKYSQANVRSVSREKRPVTIDKSFF